ncbi:PH domain-containing protein [Natronococcus occultus]|uniref:Putative membrane protein n=1 Tax=Natronococcus occultus SP4 TaxID=694430 RepID=L0JXL7_9EURY|nr:PH domain-containing protein [Natronococcus occultus]AGB37506.1 putative membrane protein [Natronococcus occultus SP4]
MRKLHPLSIAVRSISRSVNVGLLFFIAGVFASPGGAGGTLVSVGGMLLLGIVLAIGYEVAYYERFRYELTGDTFDVASGVLARRDREVPLRRIQNVDVRQPVLARVLGLAAVHIETAGGGQTEVSLQYIEEDEARRLRRQLRRGAQAEDGQKEGSETSDRRASDEREEELLFEIQPRELAILSVFTIDPGASLLGGIALSFLSGFDPTTLIPADLVEGLPGAEGGLVALAWLVVLFLLAAWVVSAVLTFNRYYGFRLTRVDDELYYERGLVQRYSGTIPLGKVQTLTITERVPFRWFGYGALAVETAGYAPGQGSRGTESAIPLARFDRVLGLARSIEPFGEVTLQDPPKRARERYGVRYLLVVGALVGAGYLVTTATVLERWYLPAVLLVLVPVAAHLKWRSRGHQLGDRYYLARTGFWRRTTKVVPYYRVQAVVHTQSIFQRRRRLANVTADTASSASLLGRAATAYDVDAAEGLEMQDTIEERLQERLRARKRERTVGEWFGDQDESAYALESNSDTPPGNSEDVDQ